MGKIDGKVVWITGASSGIGEALTYELDKKRCKLILSSRKNEELELVRNNCQNPNNIKILALDLLDFEGAPNITEQAWSSFGTIDYLINNAGISQRSLIAETEFEIYKKLIDVNYLGTVALTKALLPYFIRQNNGHFVTVTSLMGKFSSPYRSGYCGAKHALHGFFDGLRMEHEKDGVNVTLICPGFVQTNVAINALTGDGKPQNQEDEKTKNGLPPNIFAKRMISAIEKEKFEAYIGKKEVSGIYLKRFFPRMLHKVVLRSDVR
ncbi:SDR family oxidoreductase [Croceivirga thetidis]|uniref:SDR family oxidoreductase n=1 Tax=Croceivirga thetidis TaxID=2721623 RepID=A0ABX1GQB4_9FLAO|nr:SDR family oxidoreductase [Croceivirga thetidis]NKI32108.1 SDR family oxidoreductase [Croceivirga thetidis]